MSRRAFIAALGGAAAWPLVARAQQSAMPVIGFLGVGSHDLFASRLRTFHQGLKDTGYVEGENVAIEYRWAEGQYDRIPALIAELVRRQVNVIAVPASTPAAQAAKAATTTIPIVFTTATDPVAAGLIASLNRPGGNLTGVTALTLELGPKQLELLLEVVPTAKVIALVVNPASPVLAETQSRDLEATARARGLQLHVLHARAASDFDAVFAALSQLRVGGLVIGGEALFTGRSEQLAGLTLRHSMPAIYQFREFAAAGGLMSYGGSLTRHLAPRRCLYRPYSQGPEARRPTGTAVGQNRAGAQSENREVARPRNPAATPRPRRRGDRVKRRTFIAEPGGAAA